jgi:hypothetical protein
MAQLKLWKESVVVAPLFLARLGIAAPAAGNESFVAASAASSLSAKNNGVLTLNVMRHRRQPVGRYVCLLGVFFGE